MNKIEKIKLFVNDSDKSKEVADRVKKALNSKGFTISEDDFDLAIAIGGDGTFLRMVKNTNFNSDILYAGVNSGTLGFAQEIEINEIDSFIESLKNEDYIYEEIGIQEIEVNTTDNNSKFYSLNEVVIRDEELNTIGFDVYIDGILLEEYMGDGLLISTSFGSTAYNLSFGGSIVYNTFHTLQITPIAPLNNKNYRNLINSVIIPSDKEITLIPKEKTANLILTVDGDNTTYNSVSKIKVSIHNKTIKTIRKKDYNFIKKVNDKLLK